MVNPVSGMISGGIVDERASAVSVFLDLVALIPFIRDPLIFVHSVFDGISTVNRSILGLLCHCCVRCNAAALDMMKMKKNISIFFRRKK
jgi:hypothetical protein